MARKRRTIKTPAIKRKLDKPVINESLWVKSTTEVADIRSETLTQNGGVCEMTGEAIKRASLDHDHSSPPIVRGVISQHCNTMEGYIAKYFNKYCKNHTDLSISDFLRKMADYFEVEWGRGLHHRAISDYQTKLCRMTIPQLESICIKEEGLIPTYSEKKDLIVFLTQVYVNEMEFLYSKLYSKEV